MVFSWNARSVVSRKYPPWGPQAPRPFRGPLVQRLFPLAGGFFVDLCHGFRPPCKVGTDFAAVSLYFLMWSFLSLQNPFL